MKFDWLKRYMPRGIYARAALILLVPIITLQLVVSVVFIQRHFEDVTRQMTRSLVLDLEYLRHQVDAAPTLETARAFSSSIEKPLDMSVNIPAKRTAKADARMFYDLSGRVVINTLRENIPQILSVNLEQNARKVQLLIETRHGVMSVSVSRGRVSASNPHQFLVLMVFVSAVMTLVAFLFLRNQLRPIHRLAQAAEAFGKGRIMPYRPSGASEVRSAGNAFLDMRNRIERQIEQRTMMLSGVSHDLRTPLTRLKLGLAMIENSPEVQDLIKDVEEMERLLNEFLSFARSDALDDLTQVDPEKLVRDVVEKSKRGGGAVSVGTIEGQGVAMLRPVAVTRALDNLIGNALRYGTRAVVNLQVTPRFLRISVDDNGPGIPEHLREEALKPFSRLDTSRNQNRGSGVGLGLAIANDIARRHGGTLRLESSTDMGGLRAAIILPL
jgi:two-component system osmolarity sensor histidine kinase EnvZ